MISQADYLTMLQRTQRNPIRGAPEAGAESESTLQDEIEAECRRRVWPFVRTRMDRRTTFTMEGVPDFIIARPGGETFWCECKSSTGKQTPAQRGFELLLQRNNHDYRIVKSFTAFLDVLKP